MIYPGMIKRWCLVGAPMASNMSRHPGLLDGGVPAVSSPVASDGHLLCYNLTIQVLKSYGAPTWAIKVMVGSSWIKLDHMDLNLPWLVVTWSTADWRHTEALPSLAPLAWYRMAHLSHIARSSCYPIHSWLPCPANLLGLIQFLLTPELIPSHGRTGIHFWFDKDRRFDGFTNEFGASGNIPFKQEI